MIIIIIYWNIVQTNVCMYVDLCKAPKGVDVGVVCVKEITKINLRPVK